MGYKLETSEHYGVDDLIPSLERYLNAGIMPGDFLSAVLRNDLTEAFGRADHINSMRLKEIVGYLWNHFPSHAWGSKEKVAAYLKSLSEVEV